jgi:hypothetical protein
VETHRNLNISVTLALVGRNSMHRA